MEGKIKFLRAVFALVGLALLARLFFWQVIKSKELSAQARLQHQDKRELIASRGNILASDGSFLAASREAWLVFASKPELRDDFRVVANKLAPLFVEDDEDKEKLLAEAMRIERVLLKDGYDWIALKHKIDFETRNNIDALRIAGIGFEKEDARAYPEASAAAQVLGFVGKDEEGTDKGYFGLEGFYDLSLSGKPGFIERESDIRGVPILMGGFKEIPAIGGVDLITHIDKGIQLLVEERLEEGIEKYGASAGTVIVLNPKNGAVLAMSSFPSFDPLTYYQYGDDYFKNPAIADSFEPGSVFKPLVMAAALDAKVIKPETKCDICDGPLKLDKYTIETWDKEYFPDSTMINVLIHSDNVGMTFVANKLGIDKFYEYLERFELGQATQIDLQGETVPSLRKKSDWSVVDLAVASFGQGIAVTPIQLIKAMGAIANEGVIVTPQVVDKIKINNWEQDIKPELGARVISKDSAQKITQMMVLAVKEGESKWIQARGFQVAGKTGTAQIPVKGHYDEEKTIASFIGFAPANNPKFIMLVTLREPQTSPWASETAAPLWFSIASDLFPYLGIQPEG